MNVKTTDLPQNVAFEITTDDYVVRGRYRTGEEAKSWTREGRKTTRVYGALDALVPGLMKLEPFAGNYGDDAYAIPAGPAEYRSAEDNVRAAIWNAWKRETVKAGADALVKMLADVFATAINGTMVHFDGARPKFSQTAGCSCPCSPGFVLGERMTHDGRAIDLWVDLVKKD
jgi:hypothetical protein